MAYEAWSEAYERLWDQDLSKIHWQEARALYAAAEEWFKAGLQNGARALIMEGQRASRDAEEAAREEREERICAAERELKEALRSLHDLGDCAAAAAMRSEPCRFCLMQRGLAPLLACAKKMPFWG